MNYREYSMSNRDYSIIQYASTLQPDGSYLSEYGTTRWFNNKGENHRSNGPAIIYSDGRLDNVCWYINNKEYSFKEWCIKTTISDEAKMLLRLQYE
jgi:hypothetical protein